jgi:hypothetical protein
MSGKPLSAIEFDRFLENHPSQQYKLFIYNNL